MENGTSFFSNRSCAHFPCHQGVDPDEFNCLFCYCPLYALGPECGGDFRYNERGYKVCTDCTRLHEGEAGAAIVRERFRELAKLAREGAGEDSVGASAVDLPIAVGKADAVDVGCSSGLIADDTPAAAVSSVADVGAGSLAAAGAADVADKCGLAEAGVDSSTGADGPVAAVGRLAGDGPFESDDSAGVGEGGFGAGAGVVDVAKAGVGSSAGAGADGVPAAAVGRWTEVDPCGSDGPGGLEGDAS